MSFSPWRFAVAFGLGLSSAPAWPQITPEDQPRQQEGARTTDNGSKDQQTGSVSIFTSLDGIETAIRDLIAKEDETEQDRIREQESRDLKAQEEMAWWAGLMFYATAATVLLTFAALIAIIRTLYHTKRAADQAEIMAKQASLATQAAQAAVAVTEDIGKRQLRAYVGYVKTNVGSVTGRDGKIVSFLFNPVFQNFGVTPANRAAITTKAGFFNIGVIPPEAKKPTGQHPEGFLGTQIGPNGSQIGQPIPLSIADLVAAKVNNEIYVIASRMDYEDIFGKQHQSVVCVGVMMLASAVQLNAPDLDLERAFAFRFIGPDNGGD
jgi:hypothetical protein